ncbi:MAG TPA: hypothetical protein VMT55_05140, partial [Candidatus Sulfotelmatobacter sp.]|nr:hypothetical protein [Candidatus Sulfotelmatobacter sp.]
AGLTEGAAYLASDNDKLNQIFREIDRLEKTKYESRTPLIFHELYPGFTLAAFLALLLEWGLTRFWSRSYP